MRTALALISAAVLVLGACQIKPVGGPATNTGDGSTDGTGDGTGTGGTGTDTGGTDGTGGTGGTDGTGGSGGTDGTDGTGGGTDGSTDVPATGCVDVADCDDADVCTDDSCDTVTGTCQHQAVTCDDDGIPCSVEACDAVAGCSSDTTPCECLADADCDDALACNGAETCAAWQCQTGEAVVCDDSIACTDDQCVETAGGPECQAPVKTGRCYVGDSCYTHGDINPEVPCEACDFDANALGWTALAIGSACNSGSGVCGDAGCEAPPETLLEGMVWVPEGDYGMGCDDDTFYCDPDEKPKHVVFVSGFGIDKYEASVAAYAPCEEADACPTPADGYKSTYWTSGKEDHPVNHVSWDAANAFCDWRGARLCTEAEWERAARGGDDRTYPWGEEAPGCDLANLYLNGELGCGTDETSPVGSKPAGAGPYGTHDQGGNLWEYVADYYDKNAYDSSESVDPQGPATGSQRVVRGGSWKSSPSDLAGFRRHTGGSAHEGRGIRCCWSP